MFDEQVVHLHQQIKPLLEKFVRVRVVKANGLNLSKFQFDYDLTFHAFFLNADGTIYGRYGSRSDPEDATSDISMEGFGASMSEALALHQDYPRNQASLAGKQGRPVRFPRPEEYPSLKGKFSAQLDYGRNVASTCIHCHQVREAEREFIRAEKTPFSDELSFPSPMPVVLGFEMDPKQVAAVASVAEGSPAAIAGLKMGDRIRTLDGQIILSTADIQWVLDGKKDGDNLAFELERNGARMAARLALAPHWRRASSLQWRATTWDLRRMALGGLVLKELSDAERKQSNDLSGGMALAVDYIGQYGEHAAGKKAGFEKDDLITAIDGNREQMTESQAIAFLLRARKKGETAQFSVRRGGKDLVIPLAMQ